MYFHRSFSNLWNDFAVEQLDAAHCGIKWRRHEDEPVYHYEDPRRRAALAEIRRRNLPVVLEEEFENTVRFISEFPFGDPASELSKVRRLHLDSEAETAVRGGNFLRLQVRVVR